MSLQIKIVAISFMVSIVTALAALPILKKLKVRTNRKGVRTTYSLNKTRYANNGWNCNNDNTCNWSNLFIQF